MERQGDARLGGFRVESGGAGSLADDGAGYEPAKGEWRLLPPAPLKGRQSHFAFWTGTEMLVWGGPSSTVLAEPGTAVEHGGGALYDPVRNQWRQIPDAPLSPRSEMAAAYAAGRLVVWGGRDARNPNAPGLADGAAYDPATNRWSPLAEGPLPGRIRPSVVAVGDRVLIWGGSRLEQNGQRTDGALYDPAVDRWTPITSAPHPDHCFQERCTGTWTGTLAVFPYSPVAYDPDRDRWNVLAGCATAQAYTSGQTAAWTGRHLLVWRGRSPQGEQLPGAAYEPSSDRWTEIPDHPLFPSKPPPPGDVDRNPHGHVGRHQQPARPEPDLPQRRRRLFPGPDRLVGPAVPPGTTSRTPGLRLMFGPPTTAAPPAARPVVRVFAWSRCVRDRLDATRQGRAPVVSALAVLLGLGPYHR